MRVPPLWLASSTEWLLGARCALGVVLSDPRGHRGWHGQASILLNLEVISSDGGDSLCELAALHDHVVLSAQWPPTPPPWHLPPALDEEHLACTGSPCQDPRMGMKARRAAYAPHPGHRPHTGDGAL